MPFLFFSLPLVPHVSDERMLHAMFGGFIRGNKDGSSRFGYFVKASWLSTSQGGDKNSG